MHARPFLPVLHSCKQRLRNSGDQVKHDHLGLHGIQYIEDGAAVVAVDGCSSHHHCDIIRVILLTFKPLVVTFLVLLLGTSATLNSAGLYQGLPL